MHNELLNVVIDGIGDENILRIIFVSIVPWILSSISHFQNIEWVIDKIVKRTDKKILVKRIDGEKHLGCFFKIIKYYSMGLLMFPFFLGIYLGVVENIVFCINIAQQKIIYIIIYILVMAILLLIANKILKKHSWIYNISCYIIIVMLIGVGIELAIYYRYKNINILLGAIIFHTAALAIYICKIDLNHFTVCWQIRYSKYLCITLLMIIIAFNFYKPSFWKIDKNSALDFSFFLWVITTFIEYLYIWTHYEEAYGYIFINTTKENYKTTDNIVRYSNKIEYKGQNGEKHLIDEGDILQFKYEIRKRWFGKSSKNFIVHFNTEKNEEKYNGYAIKNHWIYLWKFEEKKKKVVIVKEDEVDKIDEI